MGRLVEIAAFYDPEEALCASAYLRAYGVETLLQNEHHLTMAPSLRVALGGYRVLVNSAAAKDAKRILDDVSKRDRGEARAKSDNEEPEMAAREIRDWFWLPIVFLHNVPFIPRQRTGLLNWLQLTLLALLYTTFLLLVVLPIFR